MIRGIHYFSAEVKTKLMSSQGAALTISDSFEYGNYIHISTITARGSTSESDFCRRQILTTKVGPLAIRAKLS